MIGQFDKKFDAYYEPFIYFIPPQFYCLHIIVVSNLRRAASQNLVRVGPRAVFRVLERAQGKRPDPIGLSPVSIRP